MEKNRAAFNLRRRNARKNLGGVVAQQSASGPLVEGGDVVFDSPISPCLDATPSKTSKEETLANLRRMITEEGEKPATEVPRASRDVVGGIYRNDHGGVITKSAWEKLQRLKEKAERGGYQLDEWSQ